MYNSLKGKNLVRINGNRRMLKFTPAKSGRTELPASDEAELKAISNAVRKGRPVYFLRTGNGCTLDVLLDRTVAIKSRDAARDRMGQGGAGIQLFERTSTNFIRVD